MGEQVAARIKKRKTSMDSDWMAEEVPAWGGCPAARDTKWAYPYRETGCTLKTTHYNILH